MTSGETTPLTTTSYAILGQLALRPWTMYDLARHMRNEIADFFPRAESQVYAEPKRLVALGLATARQEATGRRRRTVYQITPEGRAALTDWLAAPPQRSQQLEFEGLLRVYLASCGPAEGLLRTLDSVRQEAAAAAARLTERRERLAAGRSAAPARSGAADSGGDANRRAMDSGHPEDGECLTLVLDFLEEFTAMTEDWAARAHARVAEEAPAPRRPNGAAPAPARPEGRQ